jgi:hypothetical protein
VPAGGAGCGGVGLRAAAGVACSAAGPWHGRRAAGRRPLPPGPTALHGPAQVQGVLSAAADQWPHIQVSDSLVMADAAVRMAEAGCRSIAVLGVDFMSENVRAILDEAGHADVQARRGGGAAGRRARVGAGAAGRTWRGPRGCSRDFLRLVRAGKAVVFGTSPPAPLRMAQPFVPVPNTSTHARTPTPQVYRMSSSPIGCSLAEAAESAAYDAYLSEVGVGVGGGAGAGRGGVVGCPELEAACKPWAERAGSHP